MTRLWKNDHFAADQFVALEDDAALPAKAAVLVSLTRWREGRAALLAHDGAVGVVVDATSELDPDADALDRLAMIAIPFAKFTDGRGYSLARRLRDDAHFHGEIRATGDVLIDQIPLMLRCGFDTFAISHAPTLRMLDAGELPAIAEVYQTAVYGRARTSPRFASRPVLQAAE